MSSALQPRLGGHILIDALIAEGAELAFGVPGESYIGALDGLYARRDTLRFITCRQEGGAANMADAYGKLTGRPGICFVTRAPGACNAAVGVHTAFQDSTPMVLLVGQVPTDCSEREAVQEVDFRRMFAPLAKWAAQIDRADRIPEFISHAFHLACAGRPGPVVLAIPEDVLLANAVVADPPRFQLVEPAPRPEDMTRLLEMLETASRPIVILGGSGWDAAAVRNIQTFAEAFKLPVTCAFRFQDLFDNTHPQYAGDVGVSINPKLTQRIKDADLVVAVGPRLGKQTTSAYTLFAIPRPAQPLIHVHAGADELGRVYFADLPINSGMRAFASAAARVVPRRAPIWESWLAEAHADYLENRASVSMPGAVNLAEIVRHVSDRAPADAIIANGAGNYTAWVHRFHQYRGLRTQLAPTSGAMGYGLPAAVAAKLVHPERTVVCYAGDGCLMMTVQELATAVQFATAIVVIVVNNAMYGTIRMHQERRFPGRDIACDLRNPDFVALARSFGCEAERVDRTQDFPDAFERALRARDPYLIELMVDPEAFSPRLTMSELRNRPGGA